MQPQLIAGRYQVLRAIGHGGMGTVWLCRDEVLGREVAVKQIGALPGESATQTKRAMREARSAAALNHSNAVAVYDVVDHEGRPWLVMEYVEGHTLAEEISREGRLSPQRVADIGAQLAGALARAHERRIVHRDIKPGNVLLDKSGKPKISDFGIARGHGDEQLTQIGFITGTPGFLSPELARGGDPHSASDVWALGATLYSAVEGQSPYEPRSNPIALLRAIATERPRPTTRAGALGPAIDAMMHEDPDLRWDMKTCAVRLGAIARGSTTSVMPRVDPARTTAMAMPPIDRTQVLEAPGSEAQVLEATAPVAQPAFTETSLPKPTAATLPAGTLPVPPRTAAKPVVVEAPAVQPAVLAPPVSERPHRGTPVVPKPVTKKTVTPVAAAGLPAPDGSGDGRGDSPVAPSHDRRGGRRWLPLALVALLVTVFGGGYVFSQQGDTSAGPSKATPTATTAAKPTATSPTSAPPSPTSIQPTKVRAATDDKKMIASFVRSYYSTVTRDTSSTWNQLTPKMKSAAGGRSGYDGFWGTIARVRVNQVQADASGKTAVVSLTFTSNGGATSTETHRFRFVKRGGAFLIDKQLS